MIELKPVIGSSQVERDGYDKEARQLIVEFKTDPVPYIYLDVPPEVVMAYDMAPSKGSFLAKHVKKQFKFKRPDAEPALA